MKKILLVLFVMVGLVSAQPVVNGDLSDAQYATIAVKQNSNSSFGADIDVSAIRFYADATNSILYLGLVCKLPVTSDNGIGVWLNISGTGSPTGRAAGQLLGIQSSQGHYIGAGNVFDNINFKADFEVDYLFALNTGGSIGTPSSQLYMDAAKYVSSSAIEYQGASNLIGTSASNSSAAGSVFGINTVFFACNNGGGVNQGIEISIPFAQLNATSSMTLQAFAFVVSSTAFFSDVTVPGNITTGAPGFNADFSSLSGGPYHSDPASPLPVELTSFSASVSGKNVVLNWGTATERSNFGFEVERSGKNAVWSRIGFVPGSGNSNSTKNYSFTDYSTSANGKLLYRLKQIDTDGKFEYSKPVEVNFDKATDFQLQQNYPNPFNPTTAINFSVPTAGFVNLSIFDLLGQKVTELVNGTINAGNYTVDFNASKLNSGLYFYTLRAGTLIETRKMLLTK